MKLLLDTHVILWWLDDNARLGPRSRSFLAHPANEILISVISLWEIVMKVRSGRLQADAGAIERQMIGQGFASVGVTGAHLATLTALPVHHGDPFDHMLIAQAIVEGATLLTADQVIRRYPVAYLDCAA